MFKILLRSRLAAYWASFSGATRTKKRRTGAKAVGFALLMVYVLFCLGFMMFGIFSAIAGPFAAAGLSWLYFSMYGLMSFTLMVIGSVFMAKSQLYEAKDNDLLLAMPIKPRDILASRIITLLIVNIVFCLIVAVPAAIAWGIGAKAVTSAGQWLSFALISLSIVLLSLAISCLLALVMSVLTRRSRRKTLIDTIVSLVFMLAYFYFCFRMNSMIAALAASGSYLAGKLGSIAIVYWLGAAVAEGSLKYTVSVIIVCVAPFVLVYSLLSATFIRTVTARRGSAKIKYVDKGQKVSSAFSALYHRELSRFTSSSSYLLNAGLGAVFMIVGAVLLIIKRSVLSASIGAIPGMAEMIIPLAIMCVCLMESMTTISAASISLEGKSLWIAQSLPVHASEILKAKLALHVSILLPAALCDIIALIVVFRPTGLMLACAVLLPVLFAAFVGILGLASNLRHPNFDWLSEAQAVKNGAPVIITMFGCWGIIAVPGILAYVLRESVEPWMMIAAFTVITAALTYALYRWLLTRGARIFSEL